MSASLLFSNGLLSTNGRYDCLKNDNIELPRERRRSIAGSADTFFGMTYNGVLYNQQQTTGRNCGYSNDCFARSVQVPDNYIGGGATIAGKKSCKLHDACDENSNAWFYLSSLSLVSQTLVDITSSKVFQFPYLWLK